MQTWPAAHWLSVVHAHTPPGQAARWHVLEMQASPLVQSLSVAHALPQPSSTMPLQSSSM